MAPQAGRRAFRQRRDATWAGGQGQRARTQGLPRARHHPSREPVQSRIPARPGRISVHLSAAEVARRHRFAGSRCGGFQRLAFSLSAKLTNAIGLYLEGIRDGRAAVALDKYIGEKYTQHSTGVADGKDGFLAFFIPFLAAHPDRDIRVVRAFEDGPYVFVHVHQILDGGATQWVTTDLFDTDANDKIVEHWDVISAFTGS